MEGPIRNPSQLFYQSELIRRSILSSYWIIILLALPLWWNTTSIVRLTLPSSRVLSQSDRNLHLPVKITVGSSLTHHDSSLVAELRRLTTESAQQSPWKWSGLDLEVTAGDESIEPTSANAYLLKSSNKGALIRDRILLLSLEDYTGEVWSWFRDSLAYFLLN